MFETLSVILNDIFFTALGFFLGIWYYNLNQTRKKARERNEE